MVARDLLGCVLVTRARGVRTRGRIVETEAYLGPEDAASHAAFRPGSHWLFYGDGGFAYVYLIYGLHACLNAIAEREGRPGCVLIRAVEPLEGAPAMARRRRLTPQAPRLASGPGNVTAAFKSLGIVGPASIVVDVDGKVALVTTSGSPGELDARDAKITALAARIKDYSASAAGPKIVQTNEKFELSMSIRLAAWLVFSKKPGTAMQYKVTIPKDITCDRTTLAGDQLKPVDQTLTASVSCSGPRGIYEALGKINFGYDTPTGATGIGTDGARWKFEIK